MNPAAFRAGERPVRGGGSTGCEKAYRTAYRRAFTRNGKAYARGRTGLVHRPGLGAGLGVGLVHRTFSGADRMCEHEGASERHALGPE